MMIRRIVAPNTEVFTFTPVVVPESIDYLEYSKVKEQNNVIKITREIGIDYQKNPYTTRCQLSKSGNFSRLWITGFRLLEPQRGDITLRFTLTDTVVAEWTFDPCVSEFEVPIGDSKDTCSIMLVYGAPGIQNVRPFAHINFCPEWLGIYCHRSLEFFWSGTNTPVKCNFKLRAETLEFSRFVSNIIWHNTWTVFTVRSNLGTRRIISEGHGVLRVLGESHKQLRENMQTSSKLWDNSYLVDFQTIREQCTLVPSKTCLRSGL